MLLALILPATKFAVLMEPPVKIFDVTLILCRIIPWVIILPATTLPVTVILLSCELTTAVAALVLVKYKLFAVSTTLAVYKFNQVLAWILFVLIKLPPTIDPPDPANILPAVIFPVTVRLANVPNDVMYGWLPVVNVDPELPVYVGNADITFE